MEVALSSALPVVTFTFNVLLRKLKKFCKRGADRINQLIYFFKKKLPVVFLHYFLQLALAIAATVCTVLFLLQQWQTK